MLGSSLYSPLNAKVELIWVYGPSGSGKSYLVHEKYPDAFYKTATADFHRYAQQDTVVIEDLALNARRVFLTSLVKWLDDSPFPVTCNYKKIYIRPIRIVVCSYNHPLDFKHLKPFMPKFLSNCRIIYCGNRSRDQRKKALSDEETLDPSTSDLEDLLSPVV